MARHISRDFPGVVDDERRGSKLMCTQNGSLGFAIPNRARLAAGDGAPEFIEERLDDARVLKYPSRNETSSSSLGIRGFRARWGFRTNNLEQVPPSSLATELEVK